MARHKLLIYDLKRAYDGCTNPEKDNIVREALTKINSLTKV